MTAIHMPHAMAMERHRHNCGVIMAASGLVILNDGQNKVGEFDAYKEPNTVLARLCAYQTAVAVRKSGEPLLGFISEADWRTLKEQEAAETSDAEQEPAPEITDSKHIAGVPNPPAPTAESAAELTTDESPSSLEDEQDDGGDAETAIFAIETRDDDAPIPTTSDVGELDEGEESPDGSQSIKEARLRSKADRAKALEKMNERYAVVTDAGTAVILSDEFDYALHRRVYRRMTVGSLRTLYANQKITTRIADDGSRSYKKKADWWIEHRARRQYIDGVVFDPSGRSNGGNVLNLWRGFSVEPRKGSWERLKAHIWSVVCRGNKQHFDYLMGWMARLVQHPDRHGEVAVVLRGDLGTGKGTVGHVLLRLFHGHGIHISSSKHLTGNFNAHLRDCVFLFADEAFYAGDKPGLAVLKALITEPVLTIEGKHVNALQAPNMLHVFMASNSDWVVPASPNERRFFALDVSDEHRQERPYFAAIRSELEAGGYEAILYDLLRYDLSGFNVRDVPETSALMDQKKLSLDLKHAWWLDVLWRGYVLSSKFGLEDVFGNWHHFVSTELLYQSYLAFVKGRGDRHPISREELGKFMSAMGRAESRPGGNHPVNERMTVSGADVVYKNRPHGRVLGSLAEARKAFDVVVRFGTKWPEDEGGDG